MAEIARYLESLGERIRGFRAARGMTRKDLSRHSAVSERYLAQLERGGANPSAAVLWRLAEALGVEFASILSPLGAKRSGHAELTALLGKLDPVEQDEAFEMLRKRFDRRLEAKRGVALVGLRGAGKTTLGRSLAQQLGWPFVRLGELIVRLGGMDTAELFSLGGQKAYRRLEREALESAIEAHALAVVEAGGSLVSQRSTFDRLRSAYFTVWVRAEPEEHMQRVIEQGDTRPMQGNPRSMDDLRQILTEREGDYRSADHVLDTSGRSVGDCLDELWQVADSAIGSLGSP